MRIKIQFLKGGFVNNDVSIWKSSGKESDILHVVISFTIIYLILQYYENSVNLYA